jgi:transcriptional regulator with XRE-family HTH domain
VARLKQETYGSATRARREELELGLRAFAKKLGVSPTYVSKVERDELPPPAESRVKATAALLGIDADELLALAGKVSSDLAEIIRERPVTMASILRTARSVPEDTLRAMEKRLRDSNQGSSGDREGKRSPPAKPRSGGGRRGGG